MPAGWTLTFTRADTGAVISNTGSIAPGSSLQVIATVSIPSTQVPVTQNIYFRAKSPISGAQDVKTDAVTVKPYTDASVTPNNTMTGFAGGQVVYKHTLSNNGNTTIDPASTLTTTNTDPNFQTVLWWDKDGSGTISAGDVQVTKVGDIFPLGMPVGGNTPTSSTGTMKPSTVSTVNVHAARGRVSMSLIEKAAKMIAPTISPERILAR